MMCKQAYNVHIMSKEFPLELSHGNLAYVMILLFINIKLLIIDNYLSKGFPGQLHEALCKYIGMIFAERVYAKVAQLVEYVTSNYRLFYLWESGVRVPLCIYIFFFTILLFFVSYFIIVLFSLSYPPPPPPRKLCLWEGILFSRCPTVCPKRFFFLYILKNH